MTDRTTDSTTDGSLIVHSARVVSGGEVADDAWVRFERGEVVARGDGDGWQPADRVVDAREAAGPGAVLMPGFIDIHGHGGAGAAYDDGVDAIRTARAVHRAHGTTRAVVSLVTGTLDGMAAAVSAIAALTASDVDILGSHLEGPFLDPGHKGAHDPALLRAPAPADVRGFWMPAAARCAR